MRRSIRSEQPDDAFRAGTTIVWIGFALMAIGDDERYPSFSQDGKWITYVSA